MPVFSAMAPMLLSERQGYDWIRNQRSSLKKMGNGSSILINAIKVYFLNASSLKTQKK